MTRLLNFVTLDVFTSQRYAGNPLAVVLVPAGEDVETKQMQLIAREFNFSETVFLYEQEGSQSREWRFRIFTTNQELTFAGHPTIGTASYLVSRLSAGHGQGVDSFTLLCQAGPISCTLGSNALTQTLHDGSDSSKVVSVKVPHDFHIHSTSISKRDVMALQHGLGEDMIGHIDLVSPVKGMTFLVVELLSPAALDHPKVSGVAPVFTLDKGWDFGFIGTAFYVKSAQTQADGPAQFRYSTRMIETQMEDPATGSMSCGLAALLALRAQTIDSDFVFTQGVQMGRESHIGVQVTLNQDLQSVETLTMRGQAVNVTSGSISL